MTVSEMAVSEVGKGRKGIGKMKDKEYEVF